MWFKTLTGFHEQSPHQVYANLTVNGDKLRSNVNGREFICGTLETPSLAELRQRVYNSRHKNGRLSVREVVADVQQLHKQPANAGALFQVASQFNLLEMTSPSVTPEHGVTIYDQDRTQGPACAIAAGAGTIYRNYFANVNGTRGQSIHNQIDCLADLGEVLGNFNSRLWEMRNGYALATQTGLSRIGNQLRIASEYERDRLRQLLRIGIQWHTQVTLMDDPKQLVSQAYCSALPITYCYHPQHLWAEFALLILEAAYEATICSAILNTQATGNNKVFFTFLGGGAFGNKIEWIRDAMQRALELYEHANLDVAIVSHGASNRHIQQLITP